MVYHPVDIHQSSTGASVSFDNFRQIEVCDHIDAILSEHQSASNVIPLISIHSNRDIGCRFTGGIDRAVHSEKGEIYMRNINKALKSTILLVLSLTLLLTLSSCGWLNAFISQLKGELIGNDYIITEYDNFGNPVLQVKGDKITGYSCLLGLAYTMHQQENLLKQ